MSMSKTMEDFYDRLYLAEFGDDNLNISPNNKKFNTCLRNALKWKNYNNLYALMVYLGWVDLGDTDLSYYSEEYGLDVKECLKTVDGCKKLIMFNMK